MHASFCLPERSVQRVLEALVLSSLLAIADDGKDADASAPSNHQYFWSMLLGAYPKNRFVRQCALVSRIETVSVTLERWQHLHRFRPTTNAR